MWNVAYPKPLRDVRIAAYTFAATVPVVVNAYAPPVAPEPLLASRNTMPKRQKKEPTPHFVNSVVIEEKAQSIYNMLVMSVGLEAAGDVLCSSFRKCMAERRRRAGLPPKKG